MGTNIVPRFILHQNQILLCFVDNDQIFELSLPNILWQHKQQLVVDEGVVAKNHQDCVLVVEKGLLFTLLDEWNQVQVLSDLFAIETQLELWWDEILSVLQEPIQEVTQILWRQLQDVIVEDGISAEG